MPKKDKSQQAARSAIIQRTKSMIADIRMISEGWFGFPIDESEERGSFKGMTTRDTYTKGAHFVLLKEILPRGSIVLTTEQEATLPPLLPHIFDEEIREDRFTWLAMSFNKKATKPEKLGKVKEYRKARKQFHNDGMYAGRFDPDTDAQTVSEAFIADHMEAALRGNGAQFRISNYQSEVFPSLWVRSSTQASGEIDKTVGFSILPRHLRRTLKKLPFDQQDLSQDLREELAPWVYKATLQPVSSFMNSLRERMSVAARAGSGGARVGGSYIQGAIFNPRTLIALLNIYRVHYNFFEPRPYACPYEEIDYLVDPPKLTPRALRIPGTDEFVDLPPQARRSRARMTPAMRHGMDAFTNRKDGTQDPPDIYRMLYRPWLYMGTKLGVRFERSRGRGKAKAPSSS